MLPLVIWSFAISLSPVVMALVGRVFLYTIWGDHDLLCHDERRERNGTLGLLIHHADTSCKGSRGRSKIFPV